MFTEKKKTVNNTLLVNDTITLVKNVWCYYLQGQFVHFSLLVRVLNALFKMFLSEIFVMKVW